MLTCINTNDCILPVASDGVMCQRVDTKDSRSSERVGEWTRKNPDRQNGNLILTQYTGYHDTTYQHTTQARAYKM